MAFALFKDGKQVGDRWLSKLQAGEEALTMGVFDIVEVGTVNLRGGGTLLAKLAPGYEIREVPY